MSWTGDVGQSREQLASTMKKLGVIMTDSVTPHTRAIVVGKSPKEGKLSEAMLHNVPQVNPDYLLDFAKKGCEPQLQAYRLVPVDHESDSRPRRRHSSNWSPDYPSRASPKKRMRQDLSWDNEATSHSTEHTRPSKKPRLERSMSSSSNSGSGASFGKRAQHDSSHIRYASEDEPGAVVALEGLIGIGKSTLCNKLTQLYPDSVDVYREETNEKFLQLFYGDPKRYGFALQWGMLKSRIYQLRLAQHDTRHGRWPHRDLLFWDRSMIGDYTFALWNHLLGGISVQEMEAYESEFGGSVRQLDRIAFLRDIQLFVLMNDEPSRCKVRVEVNRKNASEQGIPLSYYEGLDDIHFHVFVELLRNRVAKVLVQPWGEYDDAETCRTLYEDAISGRIEGPKITDEPMNVKTLKASDPSVLIYRSDEDILKQYDLLSSAHTMAIEELKAFRDVYVPRDVLQIDPKEKAVNLDHLSPYNIKFYQNAFKRVVLFHLGHNQHVHFYDSNSL
jgi:deoxyadenosine/deoxycytidine kinase